MVAYFANQVMSSGVEEVVACYIFYLRYIMASHQDYFEALLD
jgi:hypothetical protein